MGRSEDSFVNVKEWDDRKIHECRGMGFTSNDAHVICQEDTKIFRSCIADLESSSGVKFPAGGPKIVVLEVSRSPTDISAEGRDIPFAMMPLYHWRLPIPHEDKKKIDEVVKSSWQRFFVAVRRTLLVNWEARDLDNVIEGGEKKEKTGIGYTIRDDVGLWIAEECIEGGR